MGRRVLRAALDTVWSSPERQSGFLSAQHHFVFPTVKFLILSSPPCSLGFLEGYMCVFVSYARDCRCVHVCMEPEVGSVCFVIA